MAPPDITQIRARISQSVRDYGWSVQSILSDGTKPTFTYTVGFTETLRHPELLMIGFDPKLSQKLLNDVGALVKSGQSFGDWDKSDQVIADLPVIFRLVPPRESREWARAASERYRQRGGFKLLQMFLPDPVGLFPWDDGCREDMVAVQGMLLDRMKAQLS